MDSAETTQIQSISKTMRGRTEISSDSIGSDQVISNNNCHKIDIHFSNKKLKIKSAKNHTNALMRTRLSWYPLFSIEMHITCHYDTFKYHIMIEGRSTLL